LTTCPGIMVDAPRSQDDAIAVAARCEEGDQWLMARTTLLGWVVSFLRASLLQPVALHHGTVQDQHDGRGRPHLRPPGLHGLPERRVDLPRQPLPATAQEAAEGAGVRNGPPAEQPANPSAREQAQVFHS